MATAEAARLLDELMGRYRNMNPDEVKDKLSYDSPDVSTFHVWIFL